MFIFSLYLRLPFVPLVDIRLQHRSKHEPNASSVQRLSHDCQLMLRVTSHELPVEGAHCGVQKPLSQQGFSSTQQLEQYN